jgi:hypothetical protein
LYRKQLVDGVYRLDEGALLDDFFHFGYFCISPREGIFQLRQPQLS